MASDHPSELDTEQILDHVLSDPSVTQFVTRRNCDGLESVTGYFRCQFDTTQERTILHVPIHPPLGNVPEVAAMLVEEIDSFRIRVTDRQKFGARLEVIRSAGLDQADLVVVEVVLTAAAENLAT